VASKADQENRSDRHQNDHADDILEPPRWEHVLPEKRMHPIQKAVAVVSTCDSVDHQIPIDGLTCLEPFVDLVD
jgi:hypothetical protein